jgi:hypothetical protein
MSLEKKHLNSRLVRLQEVKRAMGDLAWDEFQRARATLKTKGKDLTPSQFQAVKEIFEKKIDCGRECKPRVFANGLQESWSIFSTWAKDKWVYRPFFVITLAFVAMYKWKSIVSSNAPVDLIVTMDQLKEGIREIKDAFMHHVQGHPDSTKQVIAFAYDYGAQTVYKALRNLQGRHRESRFVFGQS